MVFSVESLVGKNLYPKPVCANRRYTLYAKIYKNMKKVTVYSTPTCTYCLMAKDFFDSRGVDYDDVNVAGNQEKINELMKLTGGQMGVPVIVIGKDVVFCFDKHKIEELLNS